MTNFNTLQLYSIVPEGSYSMAIANFGGEWLNGPLLRAVSPSRCMAVADFIRVSVSGIETKQFDFQVGLWSQGWQAVANYNWFFAAQYASMASFGTIEATVWRPTNAEELVYWFWMGGLATRSAITQIQSTSAAAWFLPAAPVAGPRTMPKHSAGQMFVELEQEPPEADQWSVKLQALRGLKPGWNGYDAPAPSEGALKNAETFLSALRQSAWPPGRVAPSVVGGIGITLRGGRRKVYVEFYNVGRVCALFSDGETDPQTDDVQPDRVGYQTLIDKARDYLDG